HRPLHVSPRLVGELGLEPDVRPHDDPGELLEPLPGVVVRQVVAVIRPLVQAGIVLSGRRVPNRELTAELPVRGELNDVLSDAPEGSTLPEDMGPSERLPVVPILPRCPVVPGEDGAVAEECPDPLTEERGDLSRLLWEIDDRSEEPGRQRAVLVRPGDEYGRTVPLPPASRDLPELFLADLDGPVLGVVERVVPGPGVRGDLQPGSQLARHRLDEVRYPTHSSTPASQTLTSDAEASGAVLRAVPVNCRVNTVSSWTPGVSSAVHVAE